MLATLFPSIGWLSILLMLTAAGLIFFYSFVLTKPLRLAARAFALGLTGWALVHVGALQARSACATASLRVELAAARVDLEAARHVTSQSLKRMAEADSLAALTQEKLDVFANDLAQRSAGACLLDDADARRLREFGAQRP